MKINNNLTVNLKMSYDIKNIKNISNESDLSDILKFISTKGFNKKEHILLSHNIPIYIMRKLGNYEVLLLFCYYNDINPELIKDIHGHMDIEPILDLKLNPDKMFQYFRHNKYVDDIYSSSVHMITNIFFAKTILYNLCCRHKYTEEEFHICYRYASLLLENNCVKVEHEDQENGYLRSSILSVADIRFFPLLIQYGADINGIDMLKNSIFRRYIGHPDIVKIICEKIENLTINPYNIVEYCIHYDYYDTIKILRENYYFRYCKSIIDRYIQNYDAYLKQIGKQFTTGLLVDNNSNIPLRKLGILFDRNKLDIQLIIQITSMAGIKNLRNKLCY